MGVCQLNTDMDDKESNRANCLALIQDARVMTLATGEHQEKGSWAAPVYYLYEMPGFYFFSNPNSRHICKGLDHLCAAAIFKDDPDPANLEGVQMSGTIEKCQAGPGSGRIALAYVRQFKILANTESLLEYFKTKFHARLYQFLPDSVYYMDNRIGFGAREKIDL